MKRLQTTRLAVQLFALTLTVFGLLTITGFTETLITIATIFTGVFYCGWLCPFGTIQELVGKLGLRLGIKKRKMPRIIHKYLQSIRYILLILVTFLAFDWIFTLLSYDARHNFIHLLTGTIPSTGILLVIASFLVISLFFERPFCNYFCVQGAKYGLFSSLRLFTIKRSDESCINCKKCDKVCPMNIEISNKDSVRNIQCINCLQCTSACPIENTLTYGPVEKRKGIIIVPILIIAIMLFVVYNFYTEQSAEEPIVLENRDLIESETPSKGGQHRHGQNSNTSETDNTLVDESETNDQSSTDDSQNPQDGNTSSVEDNKDTQVDDQAPAAETEQVNAENSSQEQTSTGDTSQEQVTTEETPTEETISTIYTDGTYYGVGFGFRGDMTVEVKISNDVILSVKVVDHVDDRQWFNRANSIIIPDIINTQSADVDVVSGATYSSEGIIDGAKDAIEQAKN